MFNNAIRTILDDKNVIIIVIIIIVTRPLCHLIGIYNINNNISSQIARVGKNNRKLLITQYTFNTQYMSMLQDSNTLPRPMSMDLGQATPCKFLYTIETAHIENGNV